MAATAGVIWSGMLPPRTVLAELDGIDLEELFTVDAERTAARRATLFAHGVASGDPEPHGVTLWTRLAPEAIRPQDQGKKARLAYEVAADEAFSQRLLRGVLDTAAERDHTVKAHISSSKYLLPFTTYYYRFIYDHVASRPGRFKTLPAPDASVPRLRFGYISCQDYTNGYYTALANLAEEQLDFVVHLGDYIYETVDDPSFQSVQVRPLSLPSGRSRAETLEDYRFLYQSYRSDPDLRRAHERFTFIGIWDDHEFANDAYRQYDTDTPSEAANVAAERRQAASQAWAEWTPAAVSFDPTAGPLDSIRIYRSFVFGDLLELIMTDERLYRDGPPCGLDTSQRYLTPGCPAMADPGRTMLGPAQRQWFLDLMRSSSRAWKIWGNEVMVMQLKLLQTYVGSLFPGIPPADLYFTLDQWDGYQSERAQLLRELRAAGVADLVVITGDIHTFIAGYVKEDYEDLITPPVAVCFVCGSVTSANFAELTTAGRGGLPMPNVVDFTLAAKASNPHFEYLNSSEHGYNLIEVTPEAITCTMRVVTTVASPRSGAQTLKTFRVRRGQVRIEEVGPLTSRDGSTQSAPTEGSARRGRPLAELA